MHYKKQYFLILVLAFGAFLIHVFGLYPDLVEYYYSSVFFERIRTILLFIFSPFIWSIGDCLYTLVIIYLFYKFYFFVKAGVKKKWDSIYLYSLCRKWLLLLLSIYVLFNLFWGLNYSRVTISQKLHLPKEKVLNSSRQLIKLDSILVLKVNQYRGLMENQKDSFHSLKKVLNESIVAWGIASKKYAFLTGEKPVVKSSFYGWLGNYTGFTGYYNPFTGEAQVNTTIPSFLLPFVSCHEMSHQLGFAKEAEANFAGYLIAKESPEYYFRYSAYLELFLYSNRSLFLNDSMLAKKHRMQLSNLVRHDLHVWRTFNKQHENPIEPYISKVYGIFLRQNKQPAGIESYGEVVDFLLSYYEKFHEL